jgi:hypothetical protein
VQALKGSSNPTSGGVEASNSPLILGGVCMAAAGRYELLSKQWMKHNSAKPLGCTDTLPRSMENNTVDSPWWGPVQHCVTTHQTSQQQPDTKQKQTNISAQMLKVWL